MCGVIDNKPINRRKAIEQLNPGFAEHHWCVCVYGGEDRERLDLVRSVLEPQLLNDISEGNPSQWQVPASTGHHSGSPSGRMEGSNPWSQSPTLLAVLG